MRIRKMKIRAFDLDDDFDAFKYKDESWGRCNMIIKR